MQARCFLFPFLVYFLLLLSKVNSQECLQFSNIFADPKNTFQFVYCHEKRSWQEAEQICKFQFNGNLAYFSQEDSNLFPSLSSAVKAVSQTSTATYWIGLTDPWKPREFNYFWTDGTYVNTTLMYRYQASMPHVNPLNDDDDQLLDCFVADGDHLKWNATRCDAKFPFVCQSMVNCAACNNNTTVTCNTEPVTTNVTTTQAKRCNCQPSYFGYNCAKRDLFAPNAGRVYDVFSSLEYSYIGAVWTEFSDRESPIVRYEWSVGVAGNMIKIQPFTPVTWGKQYAVRSDFPPGTFDLDVVYHVCVRAYNAANRYNTSCSVPGIKSRKKIAEEQAEKDRQNNGGSRQPSTDSCPSWLSFLCNEMVQLVLYIFTSGLFVIVIIASFFYCFTQQHVRFARTFWYYETMVTPAQRMQEQVIMREAEQERIAQRRQQQEELLRQVQQDESNELLQESEQYAIEVEMRDDGIDQSSAMTSENTDEEIKQNLV